MHHEAAMCLVWPLLRFENGVAVVATPKVAKVAKVGFEWPLGPPRCHWGHGAGGATAWAATNSKLSKFGKVCEFIGLSKFSFPMKKWAKITEMPPLSQLGGPGGLGGGTTACWAAF